MAITIYDNNKGTPGVATPHDETFTLNASAKRLWVAAVIEDNITVSATWDQGGTNQAMTSVGTHVDDAGATRIALLRLWNPTTGNKTLRVTYSAAPGSGENIFWLTDDGDTTTGIRTLYKRNDLDGTGPGLTVVDSQNNDLVLHVAAVIGTTIVFDGGETAVQTNNILGSGFSGGLSYKAATGASTVVGCTDKATYCEMGVATIPASGGTPVTPTVNDSATLAESVTIAVPLAGVNLNDAVTAAEVVTMHMPITLRMEKLS